MAESVVPEHPAKFSSSIMQELHKVVNQATIDFDHRPILILDPMAGVGTIHRLRIPEIVKTFGLEIEPEWAEQHPDTIEGDATDMAFDDESFDMIITSPPYGNRMADQFKSNDGTRRITYMHMLGRRLNENSAAGLHFGPEYQKLMRDIYIECKRVLRPGGYFVLNVSDFVRAGEIVEAVAWHVEALTNLKFKVIADEQIATKRMRFGANHTLRVNSERVITFRKQDK